MIDFHDQTFLVSGASSGLGKALALLLAQNNARVIILSSNEKALEQTYDEIIKLKKRTPLICSFNLATATAKEYEHLSKQLENEIGLLDGLIHCAGRLKALTPLEHTSMTQWHGLIQLNLNARFALTQTCLPFLKKSPHPTLAFLFSDRAITKGQAHWGAYQVAEHASNTLFEIYVDENEQSSLRVVALKAPPCDTKLYRKAYPFVEPESLWQPEDLNEAWLKLLGRTTQHGTLIDATAL